MSSSNQSNQSSQSTNTEHIEDDTSSVMSSISITNMKVECPECKKELQNRSMFKHIRLFHPEYFSSQFKVYKEADFKELVTKCRPFPVEWEYKNDFDETESKTIYGCLGCNNTFTVEAKAAVHCQVAKCKKDHIKGLKDYMKQEQKERDSRKKMESDTRYKYNNRKACEIFNDTKIILEHYINTFTNKDLINDFVKYLDKIDQDKNNEGIFSFNYCFDIKLSTDKNEMESQENYIWKLIETMTNTYKDALKIFYQHPSIIGDELYDRLHKQVVIVNSCPKLSY